VVDLEGHHSHEGVQVAADNFQEGLACPEGAQGEHRMMMEDHEVVGIVKEGLACLEGAHRMTTMEGQEA